MGATREYMKPKNNRKVVRRDNCQTPPYAIGPLLPYINPEWNIWEPACGERQLSRALRAHTPRIINTDILDGTNFFEWQPRAFDAIITNPPYSNPAKFDFLARCYDLGKPFALLVPVEILGAKTAQKYFERYGVEVLLLDKRVNFKMPRTGYENGGAQFPTFWCCWKMLPEPIVFGKIIK